MSPPRCSVVRRGAVTRWPRIPRSMLVMAAIVGAAGLPPCLAAARAGKRLMLANKEALVVGGATVHVGCAAKAARTLLPIDSEHSASLPVSARRPQRHWSRSCGSHHPHRDRAGRFAPAIRQHAGQRSRPIEACAHPNWVMGRKISVDSATMMNKALEVIEARWLFDLTPEQIKRGDPSAKHRAFDGGVSRQLGACTVGNA